MGRSNKYCKKYEKEKGWQEIEYFLDCLGTTDTSLKLVNGKAERIVLFGAGIYGEIALQHFKNKNINVLCYCDNDKKKQGKKIGGIPVISIQELSSIDNIFVIITSRHCVSEISQQLNDMKIDHISFDSYFVKLMKDKYKQVYFDLLDESLSEEVFIAVLKSMISGSLSYCGSVMEDNAFFAIPKFKNTGNEIFVDAGAYVGDTIERFIWNNIGIFRKIYAFEPGERQFRAMQIRISRLVDEWAIDSGKIICIKGGLGEKNSTLPYTYDSASPQGSNFIANNIPKAQEACIYSLDSFMGQEPITMIKADIEGFELEMLKGAQILIKRCRPKLAISLYHRPQDLYEIPLYINSLVPEYKMAIRHHSCKLYDTVLYCWIE